MCLSPLLKYTSMQSTSRPLKCYSNKKKKERKKSYRIWKIEGDCQQQEINSRLVYFYLLFLNLCHAASQALRVLEKEQTYQLIVRFSRVIAAKRFLELCKPEVKER